MRGWSTIAALALLAGCATPSEDAVDGASMGPMPGAHVEPLRIEGTVWLPPSDGDARKETLVPFPVNASGARVAVAVHLASTYGPLELPALLSDVIIELRDPAGKVLASAHVTMGEPEGDLDAVVASAGEATLAFLSYGGSDGTANGDRVEYAADVMPPEVT